MVQKHRISTNIGKDQKITVELKQDFDVLEILSLKFTQQQIYTSMCSDYGVVCGRVTANNGFGIGNARISIFVPLLEEDENDPVISKLYPYKEIADKDENGYRYNLLPSRKQHGGHAATGTFPDQSDILENEAVLEVYEKYYRYTVKTNGAGDFMIWGVPIGLQTIHVDVDLSDVGCFSLRPADFQRLGIGDDQFKNKYTFKSSEDLNSLPQIITFDRNVEVYPFWGNEDLCEIGITRTDFDLSERGVQIQPKAYLIGGVFTDTSKNAVNKNCIPRRKMGRKCDLVTKSANIEAIRFMPIKDEQNRPYLEYLPIDEDIPDDGGFVLPVEMNMDYVITNEFGENELTNDPNKGIPTSACYRFRFNLNDRGLDRTRANADFLVPNIREYDNDVDKSYYFGTEYSGFPSDAQSLILNNQNGEFYPQDYFYRFTYNKVYTVSSFHSHFFGVDAISKGLSTTAGAVVGGVYGAALGVIPTKYNFANINEISPSEENDCGDKLTPPSNFGVKNYTFQLLIADFLLTLDYIIKWVTLQFLNFIVKDVLGPLAEIMISIGVVKRAGRSLRRATSLLQINNTTKLSLINFPECEECSADNLTGGNGDTNPAENCKVATIKLTGTTTNAYDRLITLGTISGFTDTGLCSTVTPVTTFSDLTTNQTLYVLEYNGGVVFLNPNDGGSYIYQSGSSYILNDRDFLFNLASGYTVNVRKIGTFKSYTTTTNTLESGCAIYDTLYNETLATGYFVTSGATRTYKPTLSAGDDVQSTLLAGGQTAVAGSNPYGPPINGLANCRDMEGEVHYLFMTTPSYRSEFANGVFYIVPGTQSSSRLSGVLLEYFRRKRVGKMFCGGIVNYGFIDNWLSGSLYFTQFKVKKLKKLATATSESVLKYCRGLVRFVFNQNRFYYRSASFKTTTGFDRKNLNRPTTIVDLGPRDEFIKEICIDKSLDPNCSVARSIGATSYKPLGDLLGLAINYRMDVANGSGNLDLFFSNKGFKNKLGIGNVLDGDILQLLSINNEVGIEQFDLENTKYLGYRYDTLDPEMNKSFFQVSGSWGPLPVTMELDEDGERVRLCLNEPGRLTESSQTVPFYLWDKGGTGFGPGGSGRSDQSWNYNSIQLQPLQGMKYGYTATGSYSDPSDMYMLLPITNTNNGVTGNTTLNLTDVVDYDDIITGKTMTIVPPATTPTLESIPVAQLLLNYNNEYPGYSVLSVTGGTLTNPTSGTLYVRYGNAGTNGVVGWQSINWTSTTDLIIPRREDYYNGNKQILSTPYQFYFGLLEGKSGMDKFIDLYGPKDAFTSEN